MKKHLSTLTVLSTLCFCMAFTGGTAFADNFNNNYNNGSNIQAVTKITNPNEGYRVEVLNIIQSQIENVYRQYNVNVYDLAKMGRLNKYQKNAFIHTTEMYRTVLFHTIQNLEFYKEDLIAMNLDSMDAGEANRRITEIRMKTNTEYNNLDWKTNEYLRTCTYIMPSLSFQRYAQEFKRNYVLHDLYLRNYANIMKFDQIDPKYKH